MENNTINPTLNAARLTASLFGVGIGFAGLVHGIGETLQGNVAAGGLVVNSWTAGPIASNLGGEPAMTIVPNLLVTGILAILISLVVMLWAAFFVQQKHGGSILILLSIVLLLVGGGIAPPIMGILAGISGTEIHAPHGWWRKHLSVNFQHVLASLWPWVFSLCTINGLFLVLGSVILVGLLGLNQPDLFVASFFAAVVLLLLTIFTGIARDIQALDYRTLRHAGI